MKWGNDDPFILLKGWKNARVNWFWQKNEMMNERMIWSFSPFKRMKGCEGGLIFLLSFSKDQKEDRMKGTNHPFILLKGYKGRKDKRIKSFFHSSFHPFKKQNQSNQVKTSFHPFQMITGRKDARGDSERIHRDGEECECGFYWYNQKSLNLKCKC